ncbi:universal stress protein [Massilia sp. ST3]|uniref:universal stress protein n=1 Tax=Massilia sp. ST3 TaxID=2824903 RepID=UPI001B819C59|nr:universal stress protein [Massilia sp. ST3]MBQ5948489.1 universal stress protein [Massilia sp. ST3]
MYKRILVPTDGSSVSDYAVGAAIEFARACGSEILALSVAMPEPIIPSTEGAMAIDPGVDVDVLAEHAQRLAGAVCERARHAGVACAQRVELSLDPGRAIADTAREQACDLIFMGSHGRRGLSRLLAGSVTQAVLAGAPVPVMVLRPVSEDERAQALARPCPANRPA